MGSLEPGEEILPSQATKDEPGMNDPESSWIPKKSTAIVIVLGVFTLLVFVKITLRHGWRLASTPRGKARWGYISVASRLHDQGVVRAFGETRHQFALRSPDGVLIPLAELVNVSVYAAHPTLDSTEVTRAILIAHQQLKTEPLWRRLLTALNPSSITNAVGGGTW
jgi:hypothetical protein